MLRNNHLIASPLGDIEPERHRSFRPDRRTKSRQAREEFPPALRLTRVLSGEIATDVVLLAGNELLLLVERALLGEPALFTLSHERFVSASVCEGGVPLEVQNMIDDVREKGAIVADEQDRLVRLLEIGLQPLRRVEIEVIRRLIEQEHIRRADQLPCNAKAATLTATQMRKRSRARLDRIEPEPMENCIDTGREGVASLPIESLEITVVTRKHLRRGGFAELSDFHRLIRE
jgi:hypothetical protein